MNPKTPSHTKYLLAILLLVLSSLTSPTASALGSSKGPRAACRIEIDNPHISKSILRKEGKAAVKVNARSICNLYQTRVQLTVEIYQVGLLGAKLRSRYTTNANRLTSNGFTVSNKNTKWYCQSRKKSRFFGIAYATATIGGQTLAAPRAQSQKTVRLACGN